MRKSRFSEEQIIGALWSLSPDADRKLFEREPGVLVIGEASPKGKRRYTTLRVPESVVERVHRRLCNPDLPVRVVRGIIYPAATGSKPREDVQ